MQYLRPERPRGRVGFIVPRWTPVLPPDGQGVPYRAITVAGALLNAGFEVIWFDEEHDVDRADRRGELLQALESADACFFWMTELPPIFQMTHVLAMAGPLRERLPHLPIAVGGGPAAGHRPEGFYAVNWPIDYFVIGHGEETAPRLARAIVEKTPIDQVPSIVFVNEQRHTPPLKNEKLLHEHYSAYRALDLSMYVQGLAGIFGNGKPSMLLQTGRGCTKGCTFCYHSTFKLSVLRAEEIVDLAEDLHRRFGAEQFHLAELDFFASKARPLAVAEGFRKRLPKCGWFALVSPIDALRYSPAEWDLLAEGGMRKLEFGVEHGSARMLEIMGKSHSQKDILQLTDTLLARGVSMMHNFIFGTPRETAADRRESLRLIDSLDRKRSPHVFFSFRLFQPSWDSPLGEEAMRHIPDFPRTIQAGMDFRSGYDDPNRRALPWLDAADEKEIKELVYHYLPLATGRHHFTQKAQRMSYGALRALAKWRVRRAHFGLRLDHWAYDRWIRAPLDHTYTA